MFDGQFSYFLLLLFFFWVIEAVAKARQRARHPEQTPEETGTQPMPTTVESAEAEQPRTPIQRPGNLWEELAEIARQQAEQKRAEPGRRAPPSGTETQGGKHEPPRRPVPAGRGPTPARPSEFPPPTPAHAHGAPSRWEQGIGREAARTAAEGAAGDERRSERWIAGSSGEGVAAEATGAEAQGPGELSRFEKADAARRQTDQLANRPAYQPAPPTPLGQRAGVPAPRRPIHGRRSTTAAATAVAGQRAASPGPQAVGAIVVPVERSSLSVHGLRGASRAELRRLLILHEVLGPPVALREGPLAEDAPTS